MAMDKWYLVVSKDERSLVTRLVYTSKEGTKISGY